MNDYSVLDLQSVNSNTTNIVASKRITLFYFNRYGKKKLKNVYLQTILLA